MNITVANMHRVFGELLKRCPELVFIGHSVLRQKAVEVSVEEALDLGQRLQHTLLECRAITGFGRGLAAPQIGQSKAVFVTHIDGVFTIYANPKIIKHSPEKTVRRGSCFSCPFMSAQVKRFEWVEIQYLSVSNGAVEQRADGMIARLLQHECDHLQGVLNLDIAERGSLELLKNNPATELIREG